MKPLCLIPLILSIGFVSFSSGCEKKVDAKSDPKAGSGTGPVPGPIEPDLDANNFKVDKPERFPSTEAQLHVATPELNVTGTVTADVSRQVPVPSLATGKIVEVMRKVKGIEDLGVFHVLGQPNDNFIVNRKAAARYQLNVADIQDAIQTAAGGNALTQVLQGEARYDLVLRYLPTFRNTREAIENIRLLAPTGERVSLVQLCKVEEKDEGSEIYREGNQRYVAIKYSVRGRDLGGAVENAIKDVNEKVKLPRGYRLDWEGEYESQKRAQARLDIIVPLTVLLIFVILYSMFRSFKWAMLILLNVMLARVGGLLALLITHTNFSVSSGVGFLALFGVSVQTGVIMLEYINQLRVHGHTIFDSAVEGAVLRLRPIMMTMLVATLGLLPAAMSHGIGSDSQRPFAIVIVGGLISDLVMSIFLLPTLYVWMAGKNDVLPQAEAEFDPEVA